MASSISLFDPKAYHIIAYGTYLGTTFFQSFVAGPVAYRALPRPMFARLQEKLTPVLFTVQSLASALVILTFPGERTAIGTTRGPRMNAGISGLFDSTNFGSVTMPLLIVLGTSIANLAVVGPMTTKIMKQRHHQGRDLRPATGTALMYSSRD